MEFDRKMRRRDEENDRVAARRLIPPTFLRPLPPSLPLFPARAGNAFFRQSIWIGMTAAVTATAADVKAYQCDGSFVQKEGRATKKGEPSRGQKKNGERRGMV